MWAREQPASTCELGIYNGQSAPNVPIPRLWSMEKKAPISSTCAAMPIARVYPILLVVLINSTSLAQPSDEPRAIAYSLNDLQALAEQQSPAIAEAKSQLAAARGRWLQVGLPPNPTVGYVASEVGNEGRGGQQGAFVGRTLVRGGKLQLDRNIECFEIRRLSEILRATAQRVQTDVSQAYHSLLILQQRINVLTEFLTSLENSVDVTRRLVEAEETGRTDLLLANLELGETNARLKTLGIQYDAEWRSLSQVVGVPELERLPLSDSAGQHIPELSWDEVFALAVGQNPILDASSAEIQREAAATHRARVEPIPNITGQLSVQYDYATNDTVAGVQVGWPWPIRNRNQGGIREANAKMRAAKNRRQRLERQLTKELAEEFSRFQQAKILTDQYSNVLIPQASEAQEMSIAAYAEGELGMADVLNALRAARQVNLSYLDAKREMRLSYERIAGRLLTGSLNNEIGLR